MDIWQILSSVCLWSMIVPLVKGKILCACTTLDCQAERKTFCEAEYFCYVENMNAEITRGCINDKTPLLCENRRPAKLKDAFDIQWPSLYCCNEDECNRDLIPIRKKDKSVPVAAPEVEPEVDANDVNPYVRYEYDEEDSRRPCENSNDNSKLNPIYIAVPIAGVCVLLALIIFAMYLLRRRNDYETYHYHEQLARMANKQNEAKTVPQVACETNRCTDSERSSQGSETKLFLNAAK